MKRLIGFCVIILVSLIVIIIAANFAQKRMHLSTSLSTFSEPKLTTVTLALDWTPNTNHAGIYVAKEKGWYKEEGIDIKILPYSSTVSPDVLVSTGKADLGISSTEGVLASHILGEPLVSVAAIVQHNTSSLAVLAESGIERPSQLDGKIYGGFGTPSEEAIVNTIIRTDGGMGTIKNIVLDTAALEALKAKRIDAMWIYEGWEGIQAKREGVSLRAFAFSDFGIPDYYTPVIVTSPKTLAAKKAVLEKFMRATARGYEFARTNPKEAAALLLKEAPKGTFPDTGLVVASQEYLSPRYADKERRWGMQDATSWEKYPQFLLDAGAVKNAEGETVTEIDFSKLYTNELLE